MAYTQSSRDVIISINKQTKIFLKNVAYHTRNEYQINIDVAAMILIWFYIQNFNFYVLRFHLARVYMRLNENTCKVFDS